jgi:hypothetical protein
MSSFIITEQSNRISVYKNRDLSVSDVFTRAFLSVFGLTDFRIYREGEDVEIEAEDVQDLDTPQKTGEISDTLGIAQTPNGYTDLPLIKNDGDDSDDDKDVYQNLSDYIKKYNPLSKKDDNDHSKPLELGVSIRFKKGDDRSVQTLMGYLHSMNDTHSYYLINDSQITYDILNQIIRDLYIQVQYFSHMGFIITGIPTDSVYYIQGRFIVIDGEHIQTIDDDEKEAQTKTMNIVILRYVYSLIGVTDSDGDIHDKLTIIRDTPLFYTLIRIDREGIFEMN